MLSHEQTLARSIVFCHNSMHWFIACYEYRNGKKDAFRVYDSRRDDGTKTPLDMQDVKLVARYFDPERDNEMVRHLPIRIFKMRLIN